MRFRLGWSVFCAATGLLASGVPASAASPSFDCRKASSRSEKMICANPQLATLDQQISVRYKALLAQLGGSAAERLKRDQQWFITGRDDSYTEAPTVRELADTLRYRLAFLNAVRPSVSAGIVGTWRNVAGAIVIRRSPSGTLTFEANAAEPTTGRWVCEAQGSVKPAAQSTWKVAIDDPDTASIALTREGPLLTVTENPMPPEYCGLNGSLSGAYFPVADEAR
ncbi:lysozyme inhibitor LprI family protein [Novosphingobium sp.]|uniref:lysozyme inhibitor LprI family protein n=1 Tax=Novosphingobium sp. TaxID=1874826 RepID=UPI002FE01738